MPDISKRKKDHLKITVSENIAFTSKTTGFDKWDFIHCALPEICFNNIDTTVTFLSRKLEFPLIISAMTGGVATGDRINNELVEIAETLKVAFALGSMRMYAEKPEMLSKAKHLRNKTPSIPLIGNIGAVNLIRDISLDAIQKMVDVLSLDAFALHLNPLQEVIQPEGDTDFSSVLSAIEKTVLRLNCPVIVKETGTGISYDVALKLNQAGVSIIDIAGAGGTSWAAIEGYRSGKKELAASFRNWGIPTTDCIIACREIPDITLCASGGIEDGITMAKALALGADMTASARQILLKLKESSKTGVVSLLRLWKEQLQLCMFLTGCKEISDLYSNNNIRFIG